MHGDDSLRTKQWAETYYNTWHQTAVLAIIIYMFSRRPHRGQCAWLLPPPFSQPICSPAGVQRRDTGHQPGVQTQNHLVSDLCVQVNKSCVKQWITVLWSMLQCCWLLLCSTDMYLGGLDINGYVSLGSPLKTVVWLKPRCGTDARLHPEVLHQSVYCRTAAPNHLLHLCAHSVSPSLFLREIHRLHITDCTEASWQNSAH